MTSNLENLKIKANNNNSEVEQFYKNEYFFTMYFVLRIACCNSWQVLHSYQ